MSPADIDEAFDHAFSPEALAEVLKPASKPLDIQITATDDGLDVDAGEILEFALAVFLTWKRPLHALSQRGGHHLAHVRIRHHRDVARDILQFVRAATRKRSSGEPDVVGSEPGANA